MDDALFMRWFFLDLVRPSDGSGPPNAGYVSCGDNTPNNIPPHLPGLVLTASFPRGDRRGWFRDIVRPLLHRPRAGVWPRERGWARQRAFVGLRASHSHINDVLEDIEPEWRAQRRGIAVMTSPKNAETSNPFAGDQREKRSCCCFCAAAMIDDTFSIPASGSPVCDATAAAIESVMACVIAGAAKSCRPRSMESMPPPKAGTNAIPIMTYWAFRLYQPVTPSNLALNQASVPARSLS
jgi:hypothetical protein